MSLNSEKKSDSLPEHPPCVVFADNGAFQKTFPNSKIRGEPFLKAVAAHFGSADVSLALSPFFWLEFSGERKAAVTLLDMACDELKPLENPKDTYDWLSANFQTLIRDDLGLGQLIIERTAQGLPMSLERLVPGLKERVVAMWEQGQKDCWLHRTILGHLAIDRLAVRVARKNCSATQKDGIEVGKQIVKFAAEFLATNPGVSPYRLFLTAWEPQYSEGKLVGTVNHHLAENSDLLDGDLVTRSAVKLDQSLKNELVATADAIDEFNARRNHLLDVCTHINEAVRKSNSGGSQPSQIELIDSTVCFFSNSAEYSFQKYVATTPLL